MYASQDGLGAKGVKRSDAKKAVQQIYLELLLRDPFDPYDFGAKGKVDCLVEGWCDVDFLRTEVLKSDEFRALQEKMASQTREQAQATLSPGFVGGLPSAIAGVPLPYIIGGVALLLLVRKR